MRAKRAVNVVGVLALVVSAVTALVPAPAAAQAGGWSTTATLGDGVAGLELDRSTPIEAEVWAIESVGPYMLVGGAFLQVRDRSNFARIERPYLAAFDPTTGEYVPWMAAQPDGPVFDIIDIGNNRAVIAGEFSTVNGLPGTKNVAIIDVTTGLVDRSYSFDVGTNDDSVVRAIVRDGNWLYLTGSFSRAASGGATLSTAGLARVNLGSKRLDTSWAPTLQGGGGWGIGVASSGRVIVGGYFATVNNVAGTETLAALDPVSGALVAGWNHGFPHDGCAQNWRVTCGAVNGLAVANNTIFVAGAKHFWAALDPADGAVLVDNEITNDGQSVDVVDGMIVVGCHCETAVTSDEFNGIAHRYLRVIDPVSMTEVASPTINARGAAGGWAAGAAPDGCFWGGGNFTSINNHAAAAPAWSLIRMCKTGGVGVNPPLPAFNPADTVPPSAVAAPSIRSVKAATVTIGWPAAGDDSGQLFYYVFRNGELVARTSATSYSDRLLGYNTDYYWQVMASDVAGNLGDVSPRSTPVAIGPGVNVATNGTATQISDYSGTTQAWRAIDGNTNGAPSALSVSRTGARPAGTSAWWNLDLGRQYDIDTVVLHPRTDGAGGESSNRPRIYQSGQPIVGQTVASANQEGLRVWVGDVARNGNGRVDVAPISRSARYLRLFGGDSGRISFAEVQVFTTFPQATPAPAPADRQDPSGPAWKKTVNRGANTVLTWGGASDNTGVAHYEVYAGNQLVASTTVPTAPVGPAGQPASRFTIVSYDGAGNASESIGGGGTPAPVASCSVVRNGATIAVTWEAAQGADRTIVRRTVNGSPEYWRGSLDAPAVSFTDTDRAGTIRYTVEARFGDTPTTRTPCTEGAGHADPVPANLRITRIEKHKIVLTYEGQGANVDIERNGALVSTQSDNWFTDSGLSEGTTYSYRVRFEGSQKWSDPVTVTTAGDGATAAPASCSAVIRDGTVSVTWTGASNADAVVVARRVDGGTWYWRGRVDAPGTSFDDTNRSATLDYRVNAKYGNQASTWVACH